MYRQGPGALMLITDEKEGIDTRHKTWDDSCTSCGLTPHWVGSSLGLTNMVQANSIAL